MSRTSERGFELLLTGVLLTGLVTAGCANKEVKRLEMSGKPIITPPVARSLEVKVAGLAVADGAEVRPGGAVEVALTGTPGVTGKFEVFGGELTVEDSGGGLYIGRGVEVPDPGTARRSEYSILAWLEDPSATPQRGKALTKAVTAVGTAEVVQPQVIEETLEAKLATVRARLDRLPRVYFELDRAEVLEGSVSTLDRWADVIHDADPRIRFDILGACDIRGGDGYNLQLGQDRADAVRRQLSERGVDAGRLDPDSLGRSKARACDQLPADERADCYIRDRNAELVAKTG